MRVILRRSVLFLEVGILRGSRSAYLLFFCCFRAAVCRFWEFLSTRDRANGGDNGGTLFRAVRRDFVSNLVSLQMTHEGIRGELAAVQSTFTYTTGTDAGVQSSGEAATEALAMFGRAISDASPTPADGYEWANLVNDGSRRSTP